MEGWFIIFFIGLLVTVKREADNQKTLKRALDAVSEEISKDFEPDVHSLQRELEEVSQRLNEVKSETQVGCKKVQLLEEGLYSKVDAIDHINQKISFMKLEILKWHQTIRVEQDKFNTLQQANESMVNEYNECLKDKNELLAKIGNFEASIKDRAHTNKQLRAKYDEVVFKILQTKAKRISVLEHLKTCENENDALHKVVKNTVYQLKLVSNKIFPQLEQEVTNFQNYWNPLLSSFKIEAKALEDGILQDLTKYEALQLETMSYEKLKSVFEKFSNYQAKAIEEITSRRSSYNYILRDIDSTYHQTVRRFYCIVSEWLSNPAIIAGPNTGTNPTVSSFPANSNYESFNISPISMNYSNDSKRLQNGTPLTADSNELTNILKTNLFSSLNIRHLGSIINDSSFNPNTTFSSSGGDHSTTNDSQDPAKSDLSATHREISSGSAVNGGHSFYGMNQVSLSANTSDTSYSPSIDDDQEAENYLGVENIQPYDYRTNIFENSGPSTSFGGYDSLSEPTINFNNVDALAPSQRHLTGYIPQLPNIGLNPHTNGSKSIHNRRNLHNQNSIKEALMNPTMPLQSSGIQNQHSLYTGSRDQRFDTSSFNIEALSAGANSKTVPIADIFAGNAYHEDLYFGNTVQSDVEDSFAYAKNNGIRPRKSGTSSRSAESSKKRYSAAI